MSLIPPTILIIEDSLALQDILPRMLASLWPAPHTEYLAALSLQETIAILAHVLPGMVLLDLQLPDSSGLATLDALVSLLPPTVPLVVLSGTVTPLEGYQTLARGATGFLPKPPSIAALHDTMIRAWMQSHGQRWRDLQGGFSPRPLAWGGRVVELSPRVLTRASRHVNRPGDERGGALAHPLVHAVTLLLGMLALCIALYNGAEARKTQAVLALQEQLTEHLATELRAVQRSYASQQPMESAAAPLP